MPAKDWRTTRTLAWATGAIALCGLAVIATAVPAQAEQIGSLGVEATLGADTVLHIRETITYDFEGESRHGIYRDIPIADYMPDGSARVYGVDVSSITRDGQPEPFSESDEDPYLRVQIGDPDFTIDGVHTYVIEYDVVHALRLVSKEDAADPQMPADISAGDVELYWDYAGSGWQVPIQQAAATVVGPTMPLGARCYSGPADASQDCAVTPVDSGVAFGPVSVWPGEALTGDTVYPADAFTSPVVEDIRQPKPNYVGWGLLGGFIAAVLLVVIPAVIATSRRRSDAGVSMPLAPPQYSPPDDLAPAAMAAAWKGPDSGLLPRVVIATLLDLAARRWIDLDDASGTPVVTWIGKGSPALRDWEESILSAILKGQTRATVGSYDAALASAVEGAYASLVAQAEADGRRNVDGDAPDRRWNFLGLVGLACVGLGVLSIFLGIGFGAALFIPAGIGAFIGLVIARAITPRSESVKSATFQAKVAGFERVLGTDAAAARREFAHRSGLSDTAIFATMLPYAVIFNLEQSWTGAFPDLTPEQLNEYGYHGANAFWLSSFIGSASNSMASAMTPPQTSSGSGMGGGGFSGGGGGGGGGGSW